MVSKVHKVTLDNQVLLEAEVPKVQAVNPVLPGLSVLKALTDLLVLLVKMVCQVLPVLKVIKVHEVLTDPMALLVLQVTTDDQVLLAFVRPKLELLVLKVCKVTMVNPVHLVSQADKVQLVIEALQVLKALLETLESEELVVDEVTMVLEVLKVLLVILALTVFPVDQAKTVLPDLMVPCKVTSLFDTAKKELFLFAQMAPANCGTATLCYTLKETSLSTLKISAEPVLVCDNLAPCHSCFAA